MEKQTLITGCNTQEVRKSSHRIFFSQLFPQNNSDYNRHRYNASIQKLPQQKNPNSNYITFKCEVKKPDIKNDKENCDKLPIINCPKKPALIDKYFNRNDIVRDRSQQIERNSFNCLDSITDNQHTQTNKYKKFQPKTIQIERLKKTITKHSKTMDSIGEKSVIYDKQKSLQQQMKEWALIKKKNEYQAFKMIRKNNYQRMKSNMIIAQAMKELLDKRQQLLGKEEQSKEIYVPLNENDIAELEG